MPVLHHRLEFDPKLSLLGKGEKPSLEGNLSIEGDNLLALKALLPTPADKVKCIYIDPPYNTGNEGWVYNDNLTQPQFKEWIGQTVGKEGDDACRHKGECRDADAKELHDLRMTYGKSVSYAPMLGGSFVPVCLGAETMKGIDREWRHRIGDLERLGV